jgi:hypothetical protein
VPPPLRSQFFIANSFIGSAGRALARLARARSGNRKNLVFRWNSATCTSTSTQHGNPARLDDRMPRTYESLLSEGILCCPTSSCAKHSPAPGRITGMLRQAASDAHQKRQPKAISPQSAAPASEKYAEPPLRSPGDVRLQIREKVTVFWATGSLKKRHAVSITPGRRTHQAKKIWRCI